MNQINVGVEIPNFEKDVEFISILKQEKDKAICNILRIGEVKIMLDCGCDEDVVGTAYKVG